MSTRSRISLLLFLSCVLVVEKLVFIYLFTSCFLILCVCCCYRNGGFVVIDDAEYNFGSVSFVSSCVSPSTCLTSSTSFSSWWCYCFAGKRIPTALQAMKEGRKEETKSVGEDDAFIPTASNITNTSPGPRKTGRNIIDMIMVCVYVSCLSVDRVFPVLSVSSLFFPSSGFFTIILCLFFIPLF